VEASSPDRLLAAVRALPAASALLERLDGAPPVYLVGGAVRDLLLGGRPLDLDIAVDGDVEALAGRLGGEIRAHGRFGTATVQSGSAVYDLARTRRERYARPGTLPEVAPGTLAEDLRRRDFTVNAIAIALNGPAPGTLHAVPHAREDLEARRLRVLHEDSFREDPTRLLRLARYAGRLGFAPEPATAELARAAVAAGALGTVSGERLGNELRLLIREPTAPAGFAWLQRLGIAEAIATGLGAGVSEQRLRAACALLPPDGRAPRLVLALALDGVEPAQRAGLLRRLGFGAADAAVALTAAQRARALAAALAAAPAPSQIAAAAAGAPVEAVALAGTYGASEPARRWLDELRHVALSITGADVLAAGVAPGPAVGRGLAAALSAKLDGRAGSRESELEVALAAAGQA
jgi:tRNA nucleotidyltransferase (CCA-adding enzyme)